MNKRYIGAAILAPLLIFLFLGGVWLQLLVAVLSLIGMHEFYKATKERGFHCFEILGYLTCIVYYVFLNRIYDSNGLVYVVILLTFVSLCIPVFNTKHNFIESALTVVGFLYVPIFFSCIVLLNSMEYGNYLIWLIFIASWLNDTAAYYSGRFFGKGGKHKLCPKVSPNKTVEGSIGGLLGSVIGCTVFGYVISKYGVDISLLHYIIIGLLGGIFGQIGDLVASSIKRYAGIKDYSNLIPGHGGILDRFDSILFVSVVVYYYVNFIIM